MEKDSFLNDFKDLLGQAMHLGALMSSSKSNELPRCLNTLKESLENVLDHYHNPVSVTDIIPSLERLTLSVNTSKELTHDNTI